jgi:hypothetical protein
MSRKSEFRPGSQPPSGYVSWHTWAGVQFRSGLRQKRCPTCGLYRFPQEMSEDRHCRTCCPVLNAEPQDDEANGR